MNPLTKFITAGALAVIAPVACPSASAGSIYNVRIVEQGEFDCPRPDRYRPSETGGTDTFHEGTCRLVSSAQYVKATIGKNFGCSYDVLGAPNGEQVVLEHRFIIPNPGAVNPTTGEHFLTYRSNNNTSIGSTRNGIYWRPDHSGELVAGNWVFEIRHEGRLLASCTLHVSK